MRVEDIATREYPGLSRHDTIAAAAEVLARFGCNCSAVLDENRVPVGVLTVHRVLEALLRGRGGDTVDSIKDEVFDRVLLHQEIEIEDAQVPDRTVVVDQDQRYAGLYGKYDLIAKLNEQHQETKGRLEALLQSVPNGIITVDANGLVFTMNQQAEELLGFSLAEAGGRNITEFIPQSGLMRVLAKNQPEFGKVLEWKGRNLIVSRGLIKSGGQITGAVAVLNDGSRMEAVQWQLTEMKRLNDEMASLVDSSHDGIVICDRERLLKVNAAFGRITGLPPAILEGKSIRELDTEKHVCLATIQEISRMVAHHRKSMTLRRRLNSGGDIFVTGSPVFDEAGTVNRVVMNLRDVTELVALEEQIKQLSTICLDEPDITGARREAMSAIVAESPAMRNVTDLAMRVAQVDSTVLLQGESGVGKDVMARLIHKLSRRHEKSWVSVNCGAIPENLLESEFFGYDKGAFTGATGGGKPGLFEQANGGTLFLDEVGELPLPLQVKLLQVIQDRSCRRLGSVKNVGLNVRILAATNRDLKEMVERGEFREDLFYRLYVVPVEVPPLRRRRADIMPLALMFLKYFNREYGVSRTFGHELMRVLETHEWPGNVRELRNVVERLVVTADADILAPRHLPAGIYREPRQEAAASFEPGTLNLKDAKEALEKDLISRALAQCANTREAAKLLGVNHSTVVRKAQKLGLGRPREADSDGGDAGRGLVLTGTVFGDMHGRAKELVGQELLRAGFKVRDLGESVPPEEFLRAVRQSRPTAVAVSCMVSAGLAMAQQTVKGLLGLPRGQAPLVILGGAAVKESFALVDCGAQAWASDAVGCSRELIRLQTQALAHNSTAVTSNKKSTKKR